MSPIPFILYAFVFIYGYGYGFLTPVTSYLIADRFGGQVLGAANRMCLDFLAKFLKVRKSDVEIVRGQGSTTKQVLVRRVTPGKIKSLLQS